MKMKRFRGIVGGLLVCSGVSCAPGPVEPVDPKPADLTPTKSPQSYDQAAAQPVAQPTRPAWATQQPAPPVNTAARSDVLSAVVLQGLGTQRVDGPVVLRGAKNEWVSFVVRLGGVSAGSAVQFDTLKAEGQTFDASSRRVYQILPMPVDINRAGYVRHTGLEAAATNLPRALLPLKLDGETLDLNQLRDPRRPTDPAGKAAGAGVEVLLWVELLIPTPATAATYAGQLRLIGPQAATLGVNLQVYDFVIPDERNLLMVGRLEWPALLRHYRDVFEVARPNLLGRGNPDTADAVSKLDQLVRLAQEHRTCLVIPRLQPTVKWPPGGVSVDWKEFDSLVRPWLDGSAFADKVPLGYWPMPQTDILQNFPLVSRVQYYAAAAAHFDQNDWLERAPVILTKPTAGRANMGERLSLSVEAQRVMDAHGRLRIQLPLEPDQVVVNINDANPGTIDPTRVQRLNAAAQAIISPSPLGIWPNGLDRPQQWLRTDLQGLIPYVGAGGTEGDVRVWAWLAYLRNVSFADRDKRLPAMTITFEGGLPATSRPEELADPNELAWFYPGEWFGISEPLPSVQLKFLRRAEQDYEYLALARQRGSALIVQPMARLVTKPVEIQPSQAPDPTYGLFTGTADARTWADVQDLLARAVLVRGPGQPADDAALSRLNIDTLHFFEPLERPAILPRSAAWSVGTPEPNSPGPWVNLRLGIDIYNASDTTPAENELTFTRPGAGWIVDPAPLHVPKLETYQVARFMMNARVNPNEVSDVKHPPTEMQFVSGFNNDTTPLRFVLPVSRVYRRTKVLKLDGSLGEWSGDDAIQNGPMVKMVSRPAIQRHDLPLSETSSEIYGGFTDTSLLLAFKLDGVSAKTVTQSKNFVEYQFRRGWGDDLCQLIMQVLYEDGTTGPLLHVALMPTGQRAERRLDPKLFADPWQPLGTEFDYWATFDGPTWRGEILIPWQALLDADRIKNLTDAGKPLVPAMIKFNLIQHKAGTGESASWAGPLDASRDENFTGVLVFKERADPGMRVAE